MAASAGDGLGQSDQKQRIIAESFAPGACVAEVARRYGLNANMLFTRRTVHLAQARTAGERRERCRRASEHRAGEGRGAPPTATAIAPGSMGRMGIVLVGGERIIVGADVDAGALARITKALSRR